MVVRWDVTLLAAVLAGSSMLIEHSHRLDTGAPDEEAVTTRTCDAGYAWKRVTLPTDDADASDSAPASSDCASQ